jgi:hypothetical protein
MIEKKSIVDGVVPVDKHWTNRNGGTFGSIFSIKSGRLANLERMKAIRSSRTLLLISLTAYGSSKSGSMARVTALTEG